MGTKKLTDGIESGVAAVKKADDGLRLCIAIAAVTLVLAACTLVAVLATRTASA